MSKKKVLLHSEQPKTPEFLKDSVFWLSADNNIKGLNNTIIQLNDKSGNGYHFNAVGDIISGLGVKNKEYVLFTNSQYLENLDTYTQISNLSKRAFFMVYRLTDADNGLGSNSYSSIFLTGVNSYNNAGANFMHYAKDNSSPKSFRNNYWTFSLRDKITSFNPTNIHFIVQVKNNKNATLQLNSGVLQTKIGEGTINKNNAFIGNWFGRGAKMEFYEMAMFDNDTTPLNGTNLTQLQNYISKKYL